MNAAKLTEFTDFTMSVNADIQSDFGKNSRMFLIVCQLLLLLTIKSYLCTEAYHPS
jgi:hypothetical protein